MGGCLCVIVLWLTGVKCLSVDVCIYNSCLFSDCHDTFYFFIFCINVDDVQRRDLANLYGV